MWGVNFYFELFCFDGILKDTAELCGIVRRTTQKVSAKFSVWFGIIQRLSMPKRKESLTEKIRPYHIVARATDGKAIFESEEDSSRFIFQMYAANIGRPVINLYRKDVKKAAQALLAGEQLPKGFVVKEHDPLVDMFSFALAKDHYHLGLVPAQKEGIPKFMQKLNLAFAKYFNMKYKRQGALFEGRFAGVPIASPAQLNVILRYINIKEVLDMHESGWQGQGVQEKKTPLDFLAFYPYSSFPDLFHNRSSQLVSQEVRSTLRKMFGEDFFAKIEDHIDSSKNFMKEQAKSYKSLFLE